ncbi:MAG: HAD family phosphatase [Spirosomaceae bacterium]|jgi:beta-phosphoglucomutase family hydrolase|nr:HAD family phosphatase [Spirosomataceae bacterium]
MNHSNIAVIFDMDGVICDTNPYHSLAWKAFLDKHGISTTEEEFIAHMYGKSNSYILKHFLGREVVGQEFEQMEFEKELMFRQIYDEHVKPINGLLEFIDELKANGVKTGIATSAPVENMDLILSKLPLREKMGSLLASHHVSHHKPNPEVYLKSAENLGVNPTDCVVFEDSFSGVTAAINAKMKVVGVLSTYKPEELPPCNAYISDYQDINFDKILTLLS